MGNGEDCSLASWMKFLILGLVLYADSFISCTGLTCRFSQEWRGRYFQSGLGEITIRENVITTKGTCIEQSRDYYLFDNREQNCFNCLLLLRQHRNLIQYKESFCTSPASLKMVCAQIKVETPLYTLVREPSTPIRCPFQDAYNFKYNDLLHGFCEDEASHAEPCESPSTYRLKFKHCEETALYNGKDLDFECLASWKDGSETYLYSRLTGMDSDSKDDRYRCFKYHQYGNEVSLAMSADATCRGLRTAKDGPFLLEFTAENSGRQSPSCHFPDWLRGVTWRDLIGGYRYNVDEQGERMFVSLRNTSKDQISSQFRCRHITSNGRQKADDAEEYVIHSSATSNCVSSYQCLKFKKIANRIVEMHLGNPGQPEDHVHCLTEVYHNVEILTGDSSGGGAMSPAVACPRSGMHHTAPADGCIYRLNVGCRSETTIEIDHSCSPERPGLLLECLTTWSEGQRSYVIVRLKQSDILNCYSFREELGMTVFGVDSLCNRNVTLIGGQYTHLFSSLRHENCRREHRTTVAMTTTSPWQQKSTTPTRTTLETDWSLVYENYDRKEFSSSEDYDDDDDDDDEDEEEEEDYDEQFFETDQSSGMRKTAFDSNEKKDIIREGWGYHQGRGSIQREWVTRHTPSTNSVSDKDNIFRRKPYEGQVAPSTNSGLQIDRKTELKGRKHTAPMITHSTNSRSGLTPPIFQSTNLVFITTLFVLIPLTMY